MVGKFSLSSSLSSSMGFSSDPIISMISNAVGKKGLSKTGLKTAFTSNWGFSQKNSISSLSDNSLPPVSISSAPALQRTSCFFSCVCCWLGVIGVPPKWLSKTSCLWNKNNFQADRRVSWELIIFSWTRSFRVSITEFGRKSRDHWIFSLETEKNIQLNCRLNCRKWDSKRNYDHLYQPIVAGQNNAKGGMTFVCLHSVSGVFGSDWWRYCCYKGIAVWLRSYSSCFWWKKYVLFVFVVLTCFCYVKKFCQWAAKLLFFHKHNWLQEK